MTFQVAITGADELADQQLIPEVQIERRLYGHSQTRVVIRRQETDGFEVRPAAQIAAETLNCPVEITWRDNDLSEATPSFRGYVQNAAA